MCLNAGNAGMEDVVPGVLQRLRESDIVIMAGLTGAALGQDCCRGGAVSATKRQGGRLVGVVLMLDETVAQLGLSELRALGREYALPQTTSNKQQLTEQLRELLGQPETIRRVVSGLARPQRQLLAAFALAGGILGDEELRGLFE